MHKQYVDWFIIMLSSQHIVCDLIIMMVSKVLVNLWSVINFLKSDDYLMGWVTGYFSFEFCVIKCILHFVPL